MIGISLQTISYTPYRNFIKVFYYNNLYYKLLLVILYLDMKSLNKLIRLS
jgi:hypothetical protein